MAPDPRDPAYLWDMLDAARSIQEFTHEAAFEDYAQSKMMRSAVERQLEILGEAAARNPPSRPRKRPGAFHALARSIARRGHRELPLPARTIAALPPSLIDRLKPLVPPRS